MYRLLLIDEACLISRICDLYETEAERSGTILQRLVAATRHVAASCYKSCGCR